MSERYVAVIGGLNIDIAGLSGPVYRPKDSNPGSVRLSTGGVGCNIASNLVKLGVPTYLISVCGDDSFGRIAYESCEKLGIRMDGCARLPGQTSSTYLYINDNHGDLVTAVNDMRITQQMTPSFLSQPQRWELIERASVIVAEANAPQETLEWLCARVKAPVFADPVSMAKAGRLKNVLDRLDTFKPNELEAGYLTGITVSDEAAAYQAGAALNRMGVKHVFISLGAHGMLYSSVREKNGHPDIEAGIQPPHVTEIVSTNGAGDCAMAAIIWCRLRFGENISPAQVCRYAQAASGINVRSPFSIAPELSEQALLAI